ncbi:MAG: hypothetical protein Q8N95_09280 [Desulfobacterales bacterium]|nr:hypothetical protein [Desulfobacterales bacterium]
MNYVTRTRGDEAGRESKLSGKTGRVFRENQFMRKFPGLHGIEVCQGIGETTE